MTDTLMKLSSLIKNYIPSDLVLESSKAVMETLLLCIVENKDDNIRGPFVDNLTPFISASEHVELALSWIEKKAIHLPGSEEKLYELK